MLHNWGFFHNFGECFFVFLSKTLQTFIHSWFCLGFVAVVISSDLFFSFLFFLLCCCCCFGISGFGWRLGHPWSSQISIDCWMTQGNWCWRDLSSFFVCLCMYVCVPFCFLVMSFDLCFLHPLYSPWVFSWSTQNTEFNLHQ
jgi:hypothetical protein